MLSTRAHSFLPLHHAKPQALFWCTYDLVHSAWRCSLLASSHAWGSLHTLSRAWQNCSWQQHGFLLRMTGADWQFCLIMKAGGRRKMVCQLPQPWLPQPSLFSISLPNVKWQQLTPWVTELRDPLISCPCLTATTIISWIYLPTAIHKARKKENAIQEMQGFSYCHWRPSLCRHYNAISQACNTSPLIHAPPPSCVFFLNVHYFADVFQGICKTTELQNCRCWMGPLGITKPNPPTKASSLK